MSAPPHEDPFQAALRRAIQRAEEARKAVAADVPPKVAFELRRKSVHVFVAVVAVPLLLLMPIAVSFSLAGAGIAVLTVTWLIERRRAQGLLSEPYRELVHEPIAGALAKTRRPHEDYPWSPVLYTLALVILALAHEFLGLSWTIAFPAFAILGLGDAASALVGVAYGRRRLPWNRKKSVEGLLGGLVAGALGGVAMAAIAFGFYGLHFPPLFLAVVAGGALAGAFAESLPGVEDNFVVPLSAAAAMWALTWALRMPLP